MENYSGIRRSSTDRVIGGVCSGLASYLKLDPVLVRIIFVLLAIFGGGGLLAYIILWIILPEEPYFIDYKAKQDDPQPERENAATPNEESQAKTEKMAQKRQTYGAQFVGGVILIGLGVLFLLNSLIPRFNFGDYWPLILIIVGVAILRPAFKS
jgi:phage shock protein C